MTDYELRDIDFSKISQLVYEQCGIHLHEGKKQLVKTRLGKRLRGGNFKSFADYYKFVTTEKGTDELIGMIDSISTNLTRFFREEDHFTLLNKILPEIIADQSTNAGVSKLRIWCAGCSTGEEPYSIAITLKEVLKNDNVNLKILATDISTKVLKTAMAGVYPYDRVKNISPPLVRKYFQIGEGRWKGYYRVKKTQKDLVEFARFNLMDRPSFGDTFDIIFCRNVMIYFDKKTQHGLINRFYDCIKDGGYLFIGHSESLTGITHLFNYVKPSVYRK